MTSKKTVAEHRHSKIKNAIYKIVEESFTDIVKGGIYTHYCIFLDNGEREIWLTNTSTLDQAKRMIDLRII